METVRSRYQTMRRSISQRSASAGRTSGFSGLPMGAEVPGRRRWLWEKQRREKIRHRRHEVSRAFHGAGAPRTRLRGFVEEAAQPFRRQEARVARRAGHGGGFRGWLSGFCEKLRREDIRHRGHERSGALHDARDPRENLCNLIKEAAQLWSQEARAAQSVCGGGHSGPSLVRSSSRSRSRSSISAWSLRAASCSRT